MLEALSKVWLKNNGVLDFWEYRNDIKNFSNGFINFRSNVSV